MNKIIFSNNKTAWLITCSIFITGFIGIFIPFIFINYLPQSLFGEYMQLNQAITYIVILLILYFIITGVYLYKIKIDKYIIGVTSYRTISSIFGKKNFIDIPVHMLKKFRFFNKRFTLNTMLILKFEPKKGKIITKRFRMSLLTEQEKEIISKALENIITHYNKNEQGYRKN